MSSLAILKKAMPIGLIGYIRYLCSLPNFYKYRRLVSANRLRKGQENGRVFVVGSGKSINSLDLLRLRDENVIFINNVFVIPDYIKIANGLGFKAHLVAPIHPPQKFDEWKSWFELMQDSIPHNVELYFGLNHNRINSYDLIKSQNLFTEHNLNWFFASNIFSEFSRNNSYDFSKNIIAGEAASIYAIIMAIYLGFDSVYLLGMDHDYFLYDDESEMRVYKTARHQNNELARMFKDRFYIEEFFRQYRIFLKYYSIFKTTKARIFSCSGPVLKVFPRVDFNEVFND